MSERRRTFKQLNKEKDIVELNAFAKEITELYADSDSIYSQSNVAEANNLTRKCLRELMDYAIVMSLVSKQVCNQVLEKSINNQRKKLQESGGSSILHHKQLIRKREELLLNAFSNVEVYKIANEIAEETDYSINYFTTKYKIESDRITRKILERAITENIVSDEVVEKIIERSLNGITENVAKNKAKRYFDYLKEIRRNEKK